MVLASGKAHAVDADKAGALRAGGIDTEQGEILAENRLAFLSRYGTGHLLPKRRFFSRHGRPEPGLGIAGTGFLLGLAALHVKHQDSR